MAGTLALILQHARADGGEHQLNKALADFDFDAQRRLARTRMLVRAGPALGLMGTLIPLSPALTGLANGDTATLSQDLRIAFSVTVLGLLVGAVAFGISLTRERLYGQDLSDLEYLAAVTSDPRALAGDRGEQPGDLGATGAGGHLITVTPRARGHGDRAGDPLDGLVNLFDLGIVLSVAFLLAALSSLHLGGLITRHGLRASTVREITLHSRAGGRAAAHAQGRGRSAAASRPASSTAWPTGSSSTSSRPRPAALMDVTCGSSCAPRCHLSSAAAPASWRSPG